MVKCIFCRSSVFWDIICNTSVTSSRLLPLIFFPPHILLQLLHVFFSSFNYRNLLITKLVLEPCLWGAAVVVDNSFTIASKAFYAFLFSFHRLYWLLLCMLCWSWKNCLKFVWKQIGYFDLREWYGEPQPEFSCSDSPLEEGGALLYTATFSCRISTYARKYMMDTWSGSVIPNN